MDVSRQWIKSKSDLQHSPHPWARVKGPMGAAQMRLMDMNWDLQFDQGRIMLKDHMGDIWQPNPQYGVGLFRIMLEGARETHLWQKAALHRHGEGGHGRGVGHDSGQQALQL
eukprot:9574951-Karenia_brevis.AAC.1